MQSVPFRTELDLLGALSLPADCLWGIHTQRARDNFFGARRPVHPMLIKAYGAVKLAAARTNRLLGVWNNVGIADAIEQACGEIMDGSLTEHIIVDALQGGAGTSTNMNINEVIANRALQLLGQPPGSYSVISPLDDVNRHQSTNDTFPTALRYAAIMLLKQLETTLVSLQESLQHKEKEFDPVVKIGRTELQDAVLITLGREIGGWAEAFGRDRWRVYKCEERLRVVNLGGTAVGTGLGAPREYIFRVVDQLKEISGIGFSRAENCMDATQNADVFVEVSGIIKACAVNLLKVCTDLRLLASGPSGGFGEVSLPSLQAGSSIMPGKVNPVIPEAVSQSALKVFGNDVTITTAAAGGNLQINQFLPVIADCLLENIELLSAACTMLTRKCILGLQANEQRCREQVANATAVVSALVAPLGYENAAMIANHARNCQCSIRDAACATGLITAEAFDAAVSAEAVCRLGSPIYTINHPKVNNNDAHNT